MKMNESKEIKFTDTNKSPKIGFFERIKRAIFNVEKYGEFLLEKTSVAIKFLFLLVIIIAIILAGVSTYEFDKIATKAYNYIKYELPDFTYNNGKVKFVRQAQGYDEDLDLYNIINTDSELSEGVIEDYKEKVKDYKLAIIFLSEEVIVLQSGQFTRITYPELQEAYNININSKADLLKNLNAMGVSGIDITYFVASVLSLYIANLLTLCADILMVCVFGYLVTRVVGIPLKISKTLVLSIYSLTLSIILSTIYSVVFSLTGFRIEYFDVMYLLIAYIYVIAAILIIKSDLIKQQVELQKIYKVEAEVKKELEEQKEREDQEDKDKEDKKKEKDKDKEEDEPVINREPDGSEI